MKASINTFGTGLFLCLRPAWATFSQSLYNQT